MISFDNFIMEEGVPIYLQIVRHIKRGIASGEIKNRDEMPSRRVLSALLGVNPNTVQKAYHMLEEEKLIESRAGAGSCIVADPEKKAASQGAADRRGDRHPRGRPEKNRHRSR